VGHGRDSMERRRTRKYQVGLAWPVRVVLFSLALLVGFFNDATGAWGEAIAMSATALVVPVFLPQCREFWSQRQFWIAITLLTVIQVPLVVAIHNFLGRTGALYTLAFGVADCVFVITVIFFVCSKSSKEGS
jgi:hypothetical protein